MDLLGEYNVSIIFNLSDLSLFDVDSDLRANPFQGGGNDAILGSSNRTQPDDEHGSNHQSPTLQEITKIMLDLLQVPFGPITRARDKCFKEALDGLMCGLWSKVQNDLERIGPSPNLNLVHLVQVNEKLSNRFGSSIQSL